MKKIICINIFILIILLISSEFISYKILINKHKDTIENFNKVLGLKENKYNLRYIKLADFNPINLFSGFRPIEYRANNKRPIILFGCSYTEGFGLNENETFSRKLADYTNQTTYNRGKSGTGIPHLYYQFNDKDIRTEIPKNSEYFIYTLSSDHFPRLFRYRAWVLAPELMLQYKIRKGKLVQNKFFLPIHSLFTTILIEEYLENKNSQNIKKTEEISLKLFEETYKNIQKNFPDTKFVIVYYKRYNNENEYDEILNKIKKIGNIKIIYINDLLPELEERQYWLEDNYHPNSKAWEKIIPILAKELNIK